MSKSELAEALAMALNLLNDLDRDEWTPRQLGVFHELSRRFVPDSADYANNGTVTVKDLI